MATPHLPTSPSARGVVGIVAHEGGEIESGGEARLAVSEEIAKALVGVFGGAEAGELAHGPEAGAVHGGVNAAGVGRLAREAEVAGGIPVGEVGGGVEAADGIAGDGGEVGLALGGLACRSGHGEEFTDFGIELPVGEKRLSAIRRLEKKRLKS